MGADFGYDVLTSIFTLVAIFSVGFIVFIIMRIPIVDKVVSKILGDDEWSDL